MKRFFRKHYLTFMEQWYMGKFKGYKWLFNHGYIDDITYIGFGGSALSKSLKYGLLILAEGL